MSRRHDKPETEESPFRLFADLPAARFERPVLEELAEQMISPDAEGSPIPAGYTYLGQFIAHDISRISLAPDAVDRVPTAKLDLDSVYGDGFHDENVLIDRLTGRMVIGTTLTESDDDEAFEADLPRDGRALARIGDERNDDNLLTSQMHVIWLKIHNLLWQSNRADPRMAFEEARTETVKLYQHVVLHDFLKKICKPEVFEEVIEKGNTLLIHGASNRVPVEFSGAAFRFGHSMVADNYELNPDKLVLLHDILANTGRLGMGGNLKLTREWIVDWGMFFNDDSTINPASRIDPRVLGNLANFGGVPDSLAFRNLTRGNDLGLPSGQSIAAKLQQIAQAKESTLAELITVFDKKADFKKAMYFDDVRKKTELKFFRSNELFEKTPLWYYLLAEDWLEHPGEEERGEHLGTVGSIIVAETLKSLAMNSIIARPDMEISDLLTQMNLSNPASMIEIINSMKSGSINMSGVRFTVLRTQATSDFRSYYPAKNDELELSIEGGSAILSVEKGFTRLRDQLHGAVLTEVSRTIFVSKWLKVKSELDVQVVVNTVPKSIIFIWKFAGEVTTSGIVTGKNN